MELRIVATGPDSDVFISQDPTLCMRFNYQNGACIKDYRNYSPELKEKIAIYTEATNLVTRLNDSLSLNDGEDNKLPVIFIPVDEIEENGLSIRTISEFIPGLNFNQLLSEGHIGNNIHRSLALSVQRIKPAISLFLLKHGIKGVTLDTVNFKFSYDKDLVYCTDIGANIMHFAQM